MLGSGVAHNDPFVSSIVLEPRLYSILGGGGWRLGDSGIVSLVSQARHFLILQREKGLVIMHTVFVSFPMIHGEQYLVYELLMRTRSK